jgi:hypothetical protein
MRYKLQLSVILVLAISWTVMITGDAMSQVLLVPEEHQEQTMWCWAACSRAIIKYKGNPSVLQCDIVNWVRVQKGWGSGDCCNPIDAMGSSCNNGNYLYIGNGSCQDVLDHWGYAYEGHDNSLTRAQTTSQMGNSHPVMIRYDWWNGGAHALILHGFTSATDMTNIMDPWYGPYIADYDWVESGSPPGHTWTRSLTGVTTSPPVGGVDVIFIVDVTGSTSGIRPEYRAMIESLAAIYEAFAPASQYALTYFMDFPFSPYGSGSDVAYAIQTDFVATPAELQTPLDNLPDGNGADTPESQYTAVRQAITGSGVKLNADGDYNDAGEIAPTSLSYSSFNLNSYYLFTYPVDFHNSDEESNYPVSHSTPVPPFNENADSACSRVQTLQTLADLRQHGMLFSITLISQPSGGSEGSQGTPPVAQSIILLEELAEASGGTLYMIDESNAAEMAQNSFDWFYKHLATTRPIPTLSQWGMILLVVLVLSIGTFVVARRRRTISRERV